MTAEVIECAAEGSHLDVLQLLHENGRHVSCFLNHTFCCVSTPSDSAGGFIGLMVNKHKQGLDNRLNNRFKVAR